MVHSLNRHLDDEIDDVVNFLLWNERVIINDLKKEFNKRIKLGREIHKGFKLKSFDNHIKGSLKQRIKEMYTFEKRYYITAETAMLIEEDKGVNNLVNIIIKNILEEE